MLSRSLTRFFGTNSRGRFQTIVDFVVLDETARRFFGIAQLDLRPGRTGRAERQPAELQLGGSLSRAFLDQIEREGLGLFVLVLFQDFQAVDDGADRTDQVVANARAQQRRKIEGSDADGDR